MANKQRTVEWKLKLGTEGSESVTRLRSDLDKLSKIDSFASMKKDVQAAESAWKDAQAKVAALAKEIQSTESPTKKLNTEFERSVSAAGRLKAEWEKQLATLDRQRKSLAEAGISTSNLAEAHRTVTRAVAEQEQAIKEQEQALREQAQAAAASATAEQQALTAGSALASRMTAEMDGVAASMKAAVAQGAVPLKVKLTELERIDAFARLKRDSLSTKTEWQAATARVAELARAIRSTKAPSSEMVAAFERAKKQAAALKTQFDKTNISLNEQRTALHAAGINTTNLSAAQRSAKENVLRLQEQSSKAARVQDVFKRALAGTDKVTQSARVSVAGLVGAYAGLNALQMGGAALVQTLRSASTSTYLLESSVQSANREFGAGVGTMSDWQGKLQELGSELKIYSDSELRGAASRTIDMTKRLGLSVDQMAVVIERAGNLGAGKTDLVGSVERITSALRGEAEAAEFLGLTLNEDYVKSWYAAHDAHAVAWKDLSDMQKAQVRFRVMLEQTEGAAGRAAGSINTMDGAMQFMRSTMDNTISSNKDLQESIKDMATTLSAAAPDIARTASALVDLLSSVSHIVASAPEGTGSAIGTGLVVKWILGAAPEEALALLGATAGELAAIAAAYVFFERQMTAHAQVTEDSFDWVKSVNAGVRELIKNIGLSHDTEVQAGIAAAQARKQAVEQMEKLDAQRVKNLKANADAIANAEGTAAQRQKAISNQLTELKKKNWDEIEKSVKAHLKDMLQEEERYADRVKALDEKRKLAQLSGEEKIRAMLRTTMSEYDQYQDKQNEANQSMQKMYAALSSGDGEQAQFWAEKAADQFADLNSEVKDGERVIVSAAQAQATAVNGVREAYAGLDRAYQAQRDREVAGHKERQALIEQDKRTLQDIKTIQDTISDVQMLITTKDGATPTLENLQKASEKLAKLDMQLSATDKATPTIKAIDQKTGELLDDKTITVTANDQATAPVQMIETTTGLLLTNKAMDVTVNDKATGEVRIIETETGKIITNKVMDVTAQDKTGDVITDVAADVAEIPEDKTTEVTAHDNATSVLADIQARIDALQDKTITITTRYVTEGSPSGGSSSSDSFGSDSTYGGMSGYGYKRGGRIPGYYVGGRLPGYSPGRDNILAMLRGRQPIGLAGGEDITNPVSSRVIYNSIPWLMPDLNKVKTVADLSRVLAKLQNIRGYAGGGRVVDEFRATLVSGNRQATVTTRSRAEYEGLKMLVKELDWEKKVRGA